MRNAWRLYSIIPLAGTFAMLLTILWGADFFLLHVRTNLAHEIAVAACGTLAIGLLLGPLIWFGPKWRYYQIASATVEVVLAGCCGIFSWISWIDGSRVLSVFCAVFCLLGSFNLINLIKEIAKLKSNATPQQTPTPAAGKE